MISSLNKIPLIKKEENIKIKKLFINFFIENSDKIKYIPKLYDLSITDLDVRYVKDPNNYSKEIINIHIILLEPSRLIGKGGRTIKMLAGYISKHLNTKIKISFEESNLFKF